MEWIDFLLYQQIFSSDYKYKKLQCYDWWKKLFLSISKNDLRTYENIWKIATSQGDDYTTDCLPKYNCLKKYYKMIAIDLSKQQAFDADPKTIQQINFNGNLNSDGNITLFFIIEEVKETVLDFSQGTVRV